MAELSSTCFFPENLKIEPKLLKMAMEQDKGGSSDERNIDEDDVQSESSETIVESNLFDDILAM